MLIRANASDEDLEAAYRKAFEVLTMNGETDSLGDYMEFGVSIGSSMAIMHRVVQNMQFDTVHLYGFDSFEGLPETARTDDGGYWSPRMFSSDLQMTKNYLNRAGVYWNRITLVKGWYGETLNQDLIDRHDLRKASVIMIDCDMYLSTKAALDFCAPLIRDHSVILFDDWYAGGLDEKNMGEKRAFEGILADTDTFATKDLGRYAPNGRSFKVSRL